MTEKGFNPRLCLLTLLAACLLFVPACKKTSPRKPSEATEKQDEVKQTSSGGDAKKAPSNTGLVPLTIELPRPVFRGTPPNINVPDVEPWKPRPPFYAPPGTKNVALAKPVTSTEKEPFIGEVAMITDGDKEATDGSYVELGPLLQSVTIDLGATYEIYAILLWHYHQQGRVYFDVIVQVADDPDFITNVRTLFNNDNDNSSGLGIGSDMHYVDTYEGKLIDAKGIRGRYVRLYSNGNNTNDYNHYIEVEVFGKPAK